MTRYPVWYYLALLAGVLLIIQFDRPFRAIDAAEADSRQRFPGIDGLRGLLAFGVFGHHAALMRGYLETGIWQPPPSAFYTMIGEVGVALFFAVTGFLFWGKLLHEQGAPDWRRLYVGRLFRIAPAYLAVVAVMLFVVLARTDFDLREPIFAVLSDITRWLALGTLGQPDVNGYEHTGLLLAGVTWSLQYEWLYYFSLPLLALFARRDRHLWFAPAGFFACCAAYVLYQKPQALYSGLFFCGMISASLTHCGWRFGPYNRLAPVAALGCLVLLFTQFSTATGVAQLALMAIVFGAVSAGGVFPRVLGAKPVRRLGEISYSLYLVHGLVLMAVFSIGAVREYALSGHGRYWLTIALCCLLVVSAATLSYLFIERPGIRMGRMLAMQFAPRPRAGERS